MTGRNLYSIPKLYIGNKEITEFDSINLDVPGNNQLSSLKVVIGDPEYQDDHLFNQKIRFFLGEGGAEAKPIFEGYIKTISPGDTSIGIMAYDARIFLSGEGAEPIVITDKDNYDGYTPVQFITDIITKTLNTTDTIIDISALSDTDPQITMTGYRSNGKPAYDIFASFFKDIINDDNPKEPLEWYITMEGNKLIVGKRRSIDDGHRSFILSYMDGLQRLSYSSRVPANKGISTGEGARGVFEYGNSPMGVVGSIHSPPEGMTGNAELSNYARQQVMKEWKETKEISASVSRCFDIGIESMVYLSVPEKVVRGNHRVTSKQIRVAGGSVSCNLGLDKRAPRLGDYVERKIVQ